MEREEISQTCSPDGSFAKTEIAEIDSKKLWRKVDMKLLPILTVMYLFSFMDRGMFRTLSLFQYMAEFRNKANIGMHRQSFLLITDVMHNLVRECPTTRIRGRAQHEREPVQPRPCESLTAIPMLHRPDPLRRRLSLL